MSSKAPIPERWEGRRVVSAAEMRELDRRAIQEYRISALFLMENAGKGVAEAVLSHLREGLGLAPERARVLVLAGRGNNGGDGLVAARLLKGRVGSVRVLLAAPRREGGYGPEVEENLRRARDAGLDVRTAANGEEVPPEWFHEADLLVDALLGTGSSGKPAGVLKDLIQSARRSAKPIVAVDLPSGVDPDTGHHGGVFIDAAVTATLGLPKRGLLAVHAAKHVGKLVVVDIGLPEELAGGKMGRPSDDPLPRSG